MGYGALDAINTPVFGDDGLLNKIAAIAQLIGKSSHRRSPPVHRPESLPPLIVMGASTGGPQALTTILSQFPQEFPAAVIVVQHVDTQFVQGFAAWLNEQIPLPVQLAIAGNTPQPGKVLIAGTNLHSHQPVSRFYPIQNCQVNADIKIGNYQRSLPSDRCNRNRYFPSLHK